VIDEFLIASLLGHPSNQFVQSVEIVGNLDVTNLFHRLGCHGLLPEEAGPKDQRSCQTSGMS
jgi:hypothetical protein